MLPASAKINSVVVKVVGQMLVFSGLGLTGYGVIPSIGSLSLGRLAHALMPGMIMAGGGLFFLIAARGGMFFTLPSAPTRRMAMTASAIIVISCLLLKPLMAISELAPTNALIVIFSLAVLVAALAQVVSSKPHHSLILIIIAMPFLNYLRYEYERSLPDPGIFRYTFKDPILWTVIFLFGLIAATSRRRHKLFDMRDSLMILLPVFILLEMLSATFSAHRVYGLRLALAHFAAVGMYYVVLLTISDIKSIYRVMFSIVAASCLFFLIPFYLNRDMGYLSLNTHEIMSISTRIGKMYIIQNIFAQILVMVIPVAIGISRCGRRLTWKIAVAVGALVLLAALFLTYNRTGWITIIIISSLLLGIYRFRILLVGTALSLTGLFWAYRSIMENVFLPRFMINNQVDIRALVDSSAFIIRMSAWRAAIGMTMDHPLIGVGPGQFVFHYVNYGPRYYLGPLREYFEIGSAHNLYLTILAETGLVTFFVFSVIVFLTLRKCFQAYKIARNAPEPCEREAVIGLVAGILSFYVFSLFDGRGFSYDSFVIPGIWFWTICGLVERYRDIRTGEIGPTAAETVGALAAAKRYGP